MRTSPDLVGPLLVRDRTGRLSPYDECRLVASIRRRTPQRGQPEDLGAAVRQFLVQREPAPIVASERLAELVARVLEGSGAAEAATAFGDARPELPPTERLTELLDGVEGLAAGVAREVAAEVLVGLAAAGLDAPGPGLLRELIDHALARRGVVPRGLQPWLGLPGHRLRHLLNEGPPGRSAEERAGRALLRLYAHEDILPPEVWQARESGLLDIGSPAGCCRIESLTWWGRTSDSDLLSELDALVAGDICLAGGMASEGSVPRLPPRACGRRWVVCAVAGPAGAGHEVDEVDFDVPQHVVWRVSTSAPDRALLDAASRHPDRWQLVGSGPRPGLVVSAASLHLDRLAELSGRGAIEDFLLRVEDGMRLVLAGLAAWELLGPVGPARDAVLRRDTTVAPPMRWSVALRGVDRAVDELLGQKATDDGHGDDLVAAIGERLRRAYRVWRVGSRAPLATSRDLVFDDVVPHDGGHDPAAETDHAPSARSLAAAGPSRGDPVAAGRRQARRRALLGIRTDRPVVLSGAVPGADPAWHAAYLQAFFRLTPPTVTSAPCA